MEAFYGTLDGPVGYVQPFCGGEGESEKRAYEGHGGKRMIKIQSNVIRFRFDSIRPGFSTLFFVFAFRECHFLKVEPEGAESPPKL